MATKTPELRSTSKPTIAGLVSIFHALWGETELRENEEKSRKQVQLLQDVLAHDIRNYNQISRANAELLEDSLTDEKLRGFAGSILNAVDGSSELIQRALILS